MPGPSLATAPLRALRREASSAHRPAGEGLLAALADGSTCLADVLDSRDPDARRLRVREVLGALPELSPDRADRLMADLRIHRLRRLRSLSAGQRQRLTALFPKTPRA